MIERSDIEKLSAISRFADSRVSRTADWLAYQEAFQNAWPSLKSYVTSYCSRTMNWLTFSSAPDLEFCRLSRSFQSFVTPCQRKPAVPYPIPDQNGQSVFPFSDKIVPNALSFGAAHAYIAYMGEYPPPPPPGLIGHTISPFRVVKYMRFRVSGAQGSEQLFFSV